MEYLKELVAGLVMSAMILIMLFLAIGVWFI